MPSTHLSLHFHLIFSTKNRERYIHDSWRERLHAFLGGTLNRINAVPEAIGGTDDHVHLLVGLRATHCLADVLQDIKSASSKWVHDENLCRDFKWQDGYGAFTVSASLRDAVLKYIGNQMEHHRKVTFKEEYLEFLEKSGVKFEEKYLW
jgi:putative transposase